MNESKALNEALENAPVSSDIMEKLASIQSFLDPELFEQFNARIMGIVQEHPEAEYVVGAEVSKTEISLAQAQQNYTRGYQTILNHAAENNTIDIDFKNRYGGKPANDEFGEDSLAA